MRDIAGQVGPETTIISFLNGISSTRLWPRPTAGIMCSTVWCAARSPCRTACAPMMSRPAPITLARPRTRSSRRAPRACAHCLSAPVCATRCPQTWCARSGSSSWPTSARTSRPPSWASRMPPGMRTATTPTGSEKQPAVRSLPWQTGAGSTSARMISSASAPRQVHARLGQAVHLTGHRGRPAYRGRDVFGHLCRLGRRLGVPTPVNDLFYHMIRVLEQKNAGAFGAVR